MVKFRVVSTSDFQVIRQHRHSISIHIERDGSVLVRAPHLVPMFFINRFVQEKAGWIQKQLDRMRKNPLKNTGKGQEGDEYMYLGETYHLHIGDFKEISVTTRLNFPRFLSFRLQKELTDWYVSQAKKIITERVLHYADVMQAEHKKISFSDTISKWGSCAPDNSLQFNWRLIMAPILVIDYVVVHELAHTREKNHSDRFWTIVKHYKPAYKQYVKWLRDNSHRLHTV